MLQPSLAGAMLEPSFEADAPEERWLVSLVEDLMSRCVAVDLR